MYNGSNIIKPWALAHGFMILEPLYNIVIKLSWCNFPQQNTIAMSCCSLPYTQVCWAIELASGSNLAKEQAPWNLSNNNCMLYSWKSVHKLTYILQNTDKCKSRSKKKIEWTLVSANSRMKASLQGYCSTRFQWTYWPVPNQGPVELWMRMTGDTQGILVPPIAFLQGCIMKALGRKITQPIQWIC